MGKRSPGRIPLQRWAALVLPCILLLSACSSAIDVPGGVQARVRHLVDEVRPGTEVDFEGFECRKPLQELGSNYLLSSWSEIPGNPASLLDATRRAGQRSGWQPYKSPPGTNAVVLLSKAREESGYDSSEPADLDMVMWASATNDGISLYASSDSRCAAADYLQTPLHVSGELAPALTGRQRTALRDGLAAGHAAASAVADSSELVGPEWPKTVPWLPARAGWTGIGDQLTLVSCVTPTGRTGLGWSASTLTSSLEWRVPGTQQEIPETVERMRRAAGDDWQTAVSRGAADGSLDWVDFTLHPPRPAPGTPNLNVRLSTVPAERGSGTEFTIDGGMYTRCVTPR